MSTSPDAPTEAQAPAPLLRTKGFLALWTGQTISTIGNQLSGLAFPVFAVTMLGINEWQIGILNAASTASFLLVGLTAGALVDRMRKRRVMLVADVIRFVATLSIPILYFAGAIQIWHLFIAAAINGLATVFFDVSYQSYIPILVPKDKIAPANSALETTSQISGLGGPAIVGFLLTVIKAPFVLVVDAFSFLASVLSLSVIRDREVPTPKHERQPLRNEIAEGIRFVWSNKIIRSISFTTATSNLFSTAMYTLFPIVILRSLHLSVAAFGLIESLSAVGGLLGAISAAKLAKLIGEGQLVAASAIVTGLCTFGPAIAIHLGQLPAMVMLVVTQALTSFTVLTYNITQVSARQRLCPERLLGRMNASIRFFVWGVMPIGALLSGAVATAIGIIPVLWICAIGGLLSAGFVTFAPLSRMRSLGTSEDAAV
ncbi:MAG: MFS transporter [Micrococcales bacterium]